MVLQLSCVDEIDFRSDSAPSGVNISGQLSDVLEDQIVVIRDIVSLTGGANVGDPISSAIVYVLDDEGNRYEYSYEDKGEYVANYAGVSGRSYKLIVDVLGDTYESSFHQMSQSVMIDTLTPELVEEFVNNTNGQVIPILKVNSLITTNLSDDSGPVYAMYRNSGQFEFVEMKTGFSSSTEPSNVCYISEVTDLGNVVTLYGGDFPTHQVTDFQVLNSTYDYRYERNYRMRVDQYIIDEVTYNYWNRIEQLTMESSLFDPPPGRLFGNITTAEGNVATGFFTVGARSSFSTFTNMVDLGVEVENICSAALRSGVRRDSDLPLLCQDCLAGSNSTLTKPDDWPDQ